MMRIFLAGLLGGIAMFIWTSIAHMALPLGDTGVREIPNEISRARRDAGQHRGEIRLLSISLGSASATIRRTSRKMKR